jgi:hypothetical protein
MYVFSLFILSTHTTNIGEGGSGQCATKPENRFSWKHFETWLVLVSNVLLITSERSALILQGQFRLQFFEILAELSYKSSSTAELKKQLSCKFIEQLTD